MMVPHLQFVSFFLYLVSVRCLSFRILDHQTRNSDDNNRQTNIYVKQKWSSWIHEMNRWVFDSEYSFKLQVSSLRSKFSILTVLMMNFRGERHIFRYCRCNYPRIFMRCLWFKFYCILWYDIFDCSVIVIVYRSIGSIGSWIDYILDRLGLKRLYINKYKRSHTA